MNHQRISQRLLLCASIVLASSALAQPEDPTPFVSPTPLTLINGWYNAPYGTSDAGVVNVHGIVYFKGAIATSGTNPEPFVLPSSFIPATDVYISVDLCNANYGRLHIQSNGVVTVETEKAFSDAQCFTSLDGASFALEGTGFEVLELMNGWKNAPFNTSIAEVANIDGIVHFKGAVAGGTDSTLFVLPEEFRPALRPIHYVQIPVDLCNANYGNLVIQWDGTVYVYDTQTDFSVAQCFTSLDGESFAIGGDGFTELKLINGWRNGYYRAQYYSNAEVANIDGIVHFKGAIATPASNTNAEPFVLPEQFRPAHNVFIPVNLCAATNGRLNIQPNGVVTIQAEKKTGKEAQCGTMLDGAWFVK